MADNQENLENVQTQAPKDFDMVSEKMDAFFKRRLLLWAIRWTIGFVIIWAVATYWPQYSWLWWFGVIVASISLSFILLMQFFYNRRMKQSIDKMSGD